LYESPFCRNFEGVGIALGTKGKVSEERSGGTGTKGTGERGSRRNCEKKLGRWSQHSDSHGIAFREKKKKKKKNEAMRYRGERYRAGKK